MDDFIKKIKKMKMPPLKKEDLMKHILRYVNMELNFKQRMDVTPFSLGEINQLITMVEILYTLSVRMGIEIDEDGHDFIHDQADMAEMKKLIKDYKEKMYEVLNL